MITIDNFKKLSTSVGIIRHTTNIGFVETDKGLFIIDSGVNAQDGKMIADCAEKICPSKKIIAVINTHSHADHSGGNSYLKNNLDAQIWCTKTESSFLQNPAAVAYMYWGGNPIEEIKNDTFVNLESVFPDRYIGEKPVEFSNIKFEFIPLPGHFFDQTGILVTDKDDGKKTFFLGDGFFGMTLLKKFWIPFMYDQELFRKSVTEIENTYSDFYIPGHGDIYLPSNIHAIAEMNLIVTLETEFLILKLLRKKPMTSEELLKEIADYSGIKMKTGQHILIGTTLRSYLSNMEKRSLVSFEVKDNRMVWSAIS